MYKYHATFKRSMFHEHKHHCSHYVYMPEAKFIINICSKDKSIDRIVLVDAENDNCLVDDNDDVLYVRLYGHEKRSS